MINKLSYVIGKGFNPHENLALEKYLFDTVAEDEVILYLWQNRRTVVIGQNQNAWKECDVERLAADGGFVARRLSGGGAVYHDDGNLNFTFLVSGENYDTDKQFSVIKRAMELLGLPAELNGRNDLTIHGRKFSGSAFYSGYAKPAAGEGGFDSDTASGSSEEKSGGGKRILKKYHHGTIMIDVDREALSRYLTPDSAKYTSKNVQSVKSRVANLKEFNPEITVDAVREAMLAAFADVYGLTPEEIKLPAKPAEAPKLSGGLKAAGSSAIKTEDNELISKYTDFFSSPEWILNSKIKFDVQFAGRFDWGDIDIRLSVKDGIIKGAEVYSDAMDEAAIITLRAEIEKLLGSEYAPNVVAAAVSAGSLAPYIRDDILTLF